jgi:hypothetical protein
MPMPSKFHCSHPHVACVNPYTIIRKYECVDCGGVMMCQCEEEFARRHLPHQLSDAKRLESKELILVTLGFQPRVCNRCRGLLEDAAPMAEQYGRTSKLHRYYWREILMESFERFAKWAEENGIEYRPLLHDEREYQTVYARLKQEVVEQLKQQHQRSPKYQYNEKSGDEVIRENNVEVLTLDATYVKPASKGRSIAADGDAISVEEFASRHLEATGYEVLKTESTPFHVLFASLMYPVICDEDDPLVRYVEFGDRNAFDRGEKGNLVGALLPADFGGEGYARRRAQAIQDRLSEIGISRDSLLEAFDDGFGESWPLRQYLWAHRLEAAELARTLLALIGYNDVIAIIRYLVADYWGHYLGWPDLLAHKGDKYFLAEVKGAGDKLREDQKTWIDGNRRKMGLPFKFIKVRRQAIIGVHPQS